MQLYANGFTIAMSANKTEVILNFLQNAPVLLPPDQGGSGTSDVTEVKTEPVAQLILNADCGTALAQTLSQLYSE